MAEKVRVLTIDPGNQSSGYVLFETAPFELIEAGDRDNESLRGFIRAVRPTVDVLAAEEPTLTGQKFMQKEVVEAALETGRFIQAFDDDQKVVRLYRRDVLHKLFGLMPKGADQHVKAFCQETCGPVGSPKKPGPLIKLRGLKHAWQALGCGLAALKIPAEIPF